ncbi:MAG: transcription factor S [Nanoarchaeota archaeon]|nr:transcription factor S [Nanoarchaeota archaeon]
MLFCPKCGSLLEPKEQGKKNVLVCSCGYSSIEKEDIVIQEDVNKSNKIEILEEKEIETLPKADEECPKCGNKSAYYWTIQTRAGDEAETRFFQCTKCKYRWRDYS